MNAGEALVASWLLEVPVVMAWERAVLKRSSLAMLAAALVATGLSHPLAWHAMLAYGAAHPLGVWLAIEVSVALFEAAAYKAALRARLTGLQALVLSLFVNGFSAGVGLLS